MQNNTKKTDIIKYMIKSNMQKYMIKNNMQKKAK